MCSYFENQYSTPFISIQSNSSSIFLQKNQERLSRFLVSSIGKDGDELRQENIITKVVFMSTAKITKRPPSSLFFELVTHGGKRPDVI